MKLAAGDLEEAVAQGILTAEQAQRLAAWLATRAEGGAEAEPPGKFDLLHVLYYGGALLVLGGMGWWMNQAIEQLSGEAVFGLAAAYAAAFTVLATALRRRYQLAVRLFQLLAVAMTPLASYGLERAAGVWPAPLTLSQRFLRVPAPTYGHWAILCAATLIVGLLALRLWLSPLLLAAVAPAFAGLCSSVVAWRFGWRLERDAWVGVGCGLVLLLAAWLVDRRTREDFGFWLYLFGVMAFWSGLAALPKHGEIGELAFFFINLALLNASLLLQRKVFLVFGSFGCAYYFGHLAFTVFPHSLGVPLSLSTLGALLILLAVQFQRRSAQLEATLLAALPEGMRTALPRYRSPI